MPMVKMLRDATVPGYGILRKRQKVELSVAQAQYVVNRGYATYIGGTVYLGPETVQMVDTPEPIVKTVVITKDTVKEAPPLEPVGEPMDDDSDDDTMFGSRKRKKSKEG